jgi:predicted AAA+ superfamily ATPase
MIKRPYQLDHLSTAFKRAPITALLGPRQCGKTTLARTFTDDLSAVFFDLESQEHQVSNIVTVRFLVLVGTMISLLFAMIGGLICAGKLRL